MATFVLVPSSSRTKGAYREGGAKPPHEPPCSGGAALPWKGRQSSGTCQFSPAREVRSEARRKGALGA